VKYHLLSTLLLNELQKQHRMNKAQEEQLARLATHVREIDELKAQIAGLKAMIER
jgi:hypothetical protein